LPTAAEASGRGDRCRRRAGKISKGQMMPWRGCAASRTAALSRL